MTRDVREHTVHRFDDELNEIVSRVDLMGEMACNQLKRALKSLKKQDPVRAHKVVRRDRKLNDLDIEIDEKIVYMIAKRAPVAGDLRQVITLGKVVTDLERTGDEARKIAGLCIRFYEGDQATPNEHILRDIFSLGKYVQNMLQRAMQSFRDLDVPLAFNVLRMNEELDTLIHSNLRHLSTYIMEDSRNVGYFVDIILGIRALERYGGHAKNIAGHVIFLAENQDVRHMDADDIEKLLGIEEEE